MGNEQTIKKILAFPIIFRKECVAAMEEALKIAAAHAKAHHPYKDRSDTGGLTENIKGIKPRTAGNKVLGDLVAEKHYARYVEEGTKAGPPIVPKRARVLHWIDEKTGKDVFAMRARRLKHKEYPFLAPALKAKEHEIKQKFDAAWNKARRKAGLK